MKRLTFISIVVSFIFIIIGSNLSYANDFADIAKPYIQFGNRYGKQKVPRGQFCQIYQINMHDKGYTNLTYRANGKDNTIFVMTWPMRGKEVSDTFIKNTGKYLYQMGFKKVIIKETHPVNGKAWEYALK